ncbi:PEGA domain-containing protein [Aliifodinibius sp. S!AR15-10]|uniref:PEGA domain-containing protein n=1 Tax=Aliifodinibius sp. S!AR15-10 TaxID=2950437 RepID=UPI00285BFB0A|nr:PEGA domain-containing protein [Aliifodinibius sp. S!AR15-10]MDR8394547.1 PEGA domain-containing protein [Aliifodinibius sp. S!AR15-10]
MRKLSSIVFALAIILIIQACATIMHGSKQEVGISSNPSKANITVDGQKYGTTPVNIKLERKKSHTVSLELAGYQPYETTLTKSVSGWVWGNIVFGGLIGLGVDAITGGLYKLSPKQINAEFRESQARAKASKDGLFITVVLEPKSGWKKIGSLKPAN